MGKIVAITNQKGGVGKTTTAVNLSALLGTAGKRVLVVDLDPQGNTTSGLGMEAGAASIYEALVATADMAKVVEETPWPGLSIAAGDIRLVGAELELAGLPQREHRLKTVLQPIRDRFDFIMIDCPRSLSLLTVNALVAADTVLIPIQCEYFALEGVSSLMNTLNRVRKSLNPSLDIEGVLLTMLDGRTNLGLQVVDEVKKHFRQKVYATTIPRSVRLGEAPSHGEPIHVYDPHSTGAAAYRNLAVEFLGRNSMAAPASLTAAAAGKPKKDKDSKGKKKKDKKK